MSRRIIDSKASRRNAQNFSKKKKKSVFNRFHHIDIREFICSNTRLFIQKNETQFSFLLFFFHQRMYFCKQCHASYHFPSSFLQE